MKKIVLAILLFAGFAVFSITLKNRLMAVKSPLEKLPLGELMPDFTLMDTAGKEYTLSQIVGEQKLVMINFWATWCGPCRVEMPAFEKLYTEKHSEGFVLLAINEDREPEKLAAYLKTKPVSFPVLLDPKNELAERLGIESYPTTILVGPDRRILEVHEGLFQYLDYSIKAALKPDDAHNDGATSDSTIIISVPPAKTAK
jgi:peroxiredoxin